MTREWTLLEELELELLELKLELPHLPLLLFLMGLLLELLMHLLLLRLLLTNRRKSQTWACSTTQGSSTSPLTPPADSRKWSSAGDSPDQEGKRERKREIDLYSFSSMRVLKRDHQLS